MFCVISKHVVHVMFKGGILANTPQPRMINLLKIGEINLCFFLTLWHVLDDPPLTPPRRGIGGKPRCINTSDTLLGRGEGWVLSADVAYKHPPYQTPQIYHLSLDLHGKN